MASSASDPERVPQDLLQKLYPATSSWQVWKRAPEEQQLAALAEIRSQQLLGALPYMAGLFAAGSEKVRSNAADTIATLFSFDVDKATSFVSLGLHRLLDYEHVAATNALNQLKRDAVWSLKVPAESEWAVFGLISFHGNGWIREAALDRLSKVADGRELPFLLHRSTDWVSVISSKAAAELRSRLEGRPVRQFTAILPVLYRLRARQRGLLSDVQAGILRRVCKEEDLDYLQAFTAEIPGRGARRWILGLIVSIASQRPEAESLARLLRDDPDPLVRITAWNFFWSTSVPEANLLSGLNDSWAAIRRRCLELLCEPLTESRRGVLATALFDGSAMVRATARYFLEKLGTTNIADLYREKLKGSGTPSAAAIFGLSEMGNKDDAELLAGYLQSTKVSLRKAAVAAIGSLNADRFAAEIRKALFDPSPGVSKTARLVLEKHPSLISPAFVRELLAEEKPLCVRRSGLLLTRSLSKWEQILAFLEALQSAPEFNDVVVEEVRRWLSRYNRSWTEPQPDQLAKLGSLVAKNARMLAPEIVRDLQHMARAPQGSANSP
ncbi:MAG: hypothetical protein ACOZE5_15535 [Verrucomicrobiota bacterium]